VQPTGKVRLMRSPGIKDGKEKNVSFSFES